ncbi:MAG: phage holin family protein [Ornithinibacter sp.]
MSTTEPRGTYPGGDSSDTATMGTGELIARLSEQTSTLVRDEMRLAQAEYSAKAKHAATGLGMFGAGGLLALYGLGALVAAAVIALALVVPGWAAALIVGGILLAVSGVVSLLGRKQVREATPAAPERTVRSVKRDITDVKEHASHDQH